MPGDAEVILRATQVTRSYGSATSSVHALRGVSFEIGRGERVALLGKSGSGKSTLLHVLGGLDRPTSGDIWLGGALLSRMSSTELASFRLHKVGMIFQAFNLVQSMTALENVELPMIFAGRHRKERRRCAAEALEAVGLGKRLTHRPAELSGGEQQRVAVARALVNRPLVLLADEPTGNLDTETASEIIELLVSHLDRHGTSILMVTHDQELAQRCAHRILHLRDGLMIA